MSTPENDTQAKARRLMMHRSAIDCDGYPRDAGLWEEVEARLVDTNTFLQRDRFRGDLPPARPCTTSARKSLSAVFRPSRRQRTRT